MPRHAICLFFGQQGPAQRGAMSLWLQPIIGWRPTSRHLGGTGTEFDHLALALALTHSPSSASILGCLSVSRSTPSSPALSTPRASLDTHVFPPPVSFALSFCHCISKKSHFLRNTKFFSRGSLPVSTVIYAKPPQARRSSSVLGRPAAGARRRGLLCPVHMASAAPATPIAPTAADAASRSAAKTPAARPLIGHLCSVKECISLKDLKETWQAQSAYLQEADASETGARPARLRRSVEKGLGVLQTLLGQSNTVHHVNTSGRPDTQIM